MHVLIARADLVRAITSARATVPGRTTIPILGNVKLYANGAGRLDVVGTDLERQCVDGGKAEIRAAGAVTVPADILMQIAKALPDGEVSITLDAASGRIDVKCGRARYRLATLPAADFPDIDIDRDGARLTLAAADVRRLLAETAFATDTTRDYLSGAFLHTPDKLRVIRATATDGHRLISVQAPLPEGATPIQPGVIVPRQAQADIGKMLDGDDGEVTLAISGTRLSVEANGVRYVTKLIEAEFPDYLRVIPASGQPHLITVRRADLEQATARILPVLDAKDPRMRLAAGNGEIELSCRRGGDHEAADAIAAEVEGGAVEVGISPRYLLDQLAAMRGTRVSIEMAGGVSEKIRFIDEGHETDVHVVMPIRL